MSGSIVSKSIGLVCLGHIRVTTPCRLREAAAVQAPGPVNQGNTRARRRRPWRRLAPWTRSATASLYVVNPLTRQGLATLFATHPPVAERVRRLRALDHDHALVHHQALRVAA